MGVNGISNQTYHDDIPHSHKPAMNTLDPSKNHPSVSSYGAPAMHGTWGTVLGIISVCLTMDPHS